MMTKEEIDKKITELENNEDLNKAMQKLHRDLCDAMITYLKTCDSKKINRKDSLATELMTVSQWVKSFIEQIGISTSDEKTATALQMEFCKMVVGETMNKVFKKANA